MSRKYYTLDVFTDRALAGNPLAVVLDSDGLNGEQMQAIAGEFNLSETVFVGARGETPNSVSVRIFTPKQELAFAGHPTVGTAILLNQLNHLDLQNDFVLEEKVGPVSCRISETDGLKIARFGLPRVSEKVDQPLDVELVAKSIGLSVADLDAEKVEYWDGGNCFTMIPVKSMEAVARAKADSLVLDEITPVIHGHGANPFLFCTGGEASDADFHARMFAPNFGIPEDPATGSAVAAMSGWIAQHIMGENESRSFKIEQGYEMGRPSQIYLDLEKRNGAVAAGGISGSAVIVGDGNLHI